MKALPTEQGNRCCTAFPHALLLRSIAGMLLCLGCLAAPCAHAALLQVLPPLHRTLTDSVTGVEYAVLADSGKSTNLYFHQRSWLADNSVVLYTGPTSAQKLMGFIQATGERFVIGNISGATAAVTRNSVFGMRGSKVVEIALSITISPNPAQTSSRVEATERTIKSLSFASQINGNYDDAYLSAYENNESVSPKRYTVYRISMATGQMNEVCRAGSNITHLQWSRTASNLLMFAGPDDARLWVVNPWDATPVPRNVYSQVASMGEWVTHESWWVNDQILFCGAPWAVGYETDPQRAEYHHLNILDPNTGVARILGAGTWLPGQDLAAMWKRSFHHASGDVEGRWAVADNFSGTLTLTEAKTARTRIFTVGHRTYGGGEHSHPSFDRSGRQVVFVSNRFGEPRVCVARIPDAWRETSKPIITSVERAEVRGTLTGDRATPAPALGGNAPNPFNPATVIRYSVPAAEHVVLSIYNINGQLVRTLVDEPRRQGEHTATWDGRDSRGMTVGTGTYICRLVTPSGVATVRLTLIR